MKLRYSCRKERKNKPRRKKTKLGFSRFKACSAAVGISLMLISGNAVAQDKPKKDDIQNEQKKEISEEQKKLNKELLQAAEKGDIKEVKKLLKKGADVNSIDANLPDGTPILYACENNDTKIVKLLLNHGANVNFKTFGMVGVQYYMPLKTIIWR